MSVENKFPDVSSVYTETPYENNKQIVINRYKLFIFMIQIKNMSLINLKST